MKTKLLALMFLAGSAVFAGPRVFVGVGVGVPYAPPVVAYPPPVVTYAAPGPEFVFVGGHWVRRGYWAAPRYYGHPHYGHAYGRGYRR